MSSPNRQTINLSAEVLSVYRDPGRNGSLAQNFSHALEVGRAAAAFHNGYYIPGFYQSRRNIQTFAVHGNMPMGHQLTSLTTGMGQAQAIYHVVQSAFQQNQQVGTNDTFHFLGFS